MLVWHCTSKLNVVISVKVNNARYGVGNRESDGECICKTVKNKSKNFDENESVSMLFFWRAQRHL